MEKGRGRGTGSPGKRFFPGLVTFLFGAALLPTASGHAIYRWVSPSGVVSYGDQPVPGARRIQPVPVLPAPPASFTPPVPPVSGATGARRHRSSAAVRRLLLLMAIRQMEQNRAYQYRHRHRYHDYLFPGYGGFPEGRFPHQRPYGLPYGGQPDRFRGFGQPQPEPPRVLLPNPAPQSSYSNPMILPHRRP